MCGIYLACRQDHVQDPTSTIRRDLASRGPDCCKSIGRTIQRPAFADVSQSATEQPSTYLTFISTVLSLRGDDVVEQPLVDPASQSILCWNGEAWNIDGRSVTGNDATAVFDFLIKRTNLGDSSSSARDACHVSRVIDAFSRITGPYAFVFYDANSSQIFYGRDILGRRSLLVNKHQQSSIIISSICDSDSCPEEEWVEVEPNSIHVLKFRAEKDGFAAEKQNLGDIYKLSNYKIFDQQVSEIYHLPGSTTADGSVISLSGGLNWRR